MHLSAGWVYVHVPLSEYKIAEDMKPEKEIWCVSASFILIIDDIQHYWYSERRTDSMTLNCSTQDADEIYYIFMLL